MRSGRPADGRKADRSHRLEAESMARAGSSLLLKDGNEERGTHRAGAGAGGREPQVTAGLRYKSHDPVQQDERIRYHAEKERKMRNLD